FRGPIIFAPAMDEGMYRNEIFRENLNKLKNKGYHIIPPDKGILASGKIGEGRFPAVEEVIKYVGSILSGKPARRDFSGGEDFKGIKVLITAGGTREFLDPVRFIGNASSGKMGYALAEAARERGADVKLITTPVSLPKPNGFEMINVVTASQMQDAVIKNFASTDVLIMAAAVGDFRPKTFAKEKRKRNQGKWDIELVPNPDILAEVAKIKKGEITVGFSIETQNQIKQAKEKLNKKNLDLIVANDITVKKSGFCSDTNKAVLIDKKGKTEKLPLISKRELADIILDRIQNIGRRKWERKK
ncbi:MAG: bifunctional phosphopantothenoylcysteine decarboxylase/phosphopantothenate--cysteine ligase CoaBC, partial [Candidatus Ratteibacteria bacterium]|nr:bifunctional phosphopantothenoylcysteine decarboxylase/phosphopantothenate--cysteine ligase CoaBC [Candidatus Ratteibacteria bacterium]